VYTRADMCLGVSLVGKRPVVLLLTRSILEKNPIKIGVCTRADMYLGVYICVSFCVSVSVSVSAWLSFSVSGY